MPVEEEERDFFFYFLKEIFLIFSCSAALTAVFENKRLKLFL